MDHASDQGARAARDTVARLRADCARCAALCCVVPAFSRSSDFAIDKPSGRPCPNLQHDFRCGIHDDLRPRGFAGCTVYDCLGAGQHVVQVVFGGRTWREDPDVADLVGDVFPVVRALHELLRYAAEARAHPATVELGGPLDEVCRRLGETLDENADVLARLDIDQLRAGVNPLLVRASEAMRAAWPRHDVDHRGADLVGTDLRTADLRGASLRGARLVGADLADADLRGADVTGADLRGADLAGADLSETYFLLRSQLESARGDARTRLSAEHPRPLHWH
jgi:hypothetical protein